MSVPLPQALTYTEYPAPADLQPWLACIWSTQGMAAQPLWHRVLPDGCADALLDLTGETAWTLVGPMHQAVQVPLHGLVDVLGIRFRPGGLHGLLRMPLFELVDDVAALAAVDVCLARAWPGERLQGMHRRDQVQQLWIWLRAGVQRAPCPLTACSVHIWQTDATSVSALAAQLGVSTRQLQRRVLEHTGYTPAELRALLRFRRLLGVHAARPTWTWSGLALAAGYADQAHLCREFQRWAGVTPQAWAATQAVASIQDGRVNWGQHASLPSADVRSPP